MNRKTSPTDSVVNVHGFEHLLRVLGGNCVVSKRKYSLRVYLEVNSKKSNKKVRQMFEIVQNQYLL